MRGPLPYERMNVYPHLSKREAPIWDTFIRRNPGMFTRVWYDVQVGERRADSTELAPEWERNAAYLGAYKIDVVADAGPYLLVIELKHQATTKALGEVWLYEHLLKKAWGTEKPILSAIVTDEEMPNIREVAEADGVQLFVVPLGGSDSTTATPQGEASEREEPHTDEYGENTESDRRSEPRELSV